MLVFGLPCTWCGKQVICHLAVGVGNPGWTAIAMGGWRAETVVGWRNDWGVMGVRVGVEMRPPPQGGGPGGAPPGK